MSKYLHEILLSLAGHPSPLFNRVSLENETKDESDDESPSFKELSSLLSPPEKTLLASLGRLGKLHENIRVHTSIISSSHFSTICRTVSTSIASVHLRRYRRKVVEVEAMILEKSPIMVGGYGIVPLSAMVDQFDGWDRMLSWLWELTLIMMPLAPEKLTKIKGKEPEADDPCSGAAIINHLRDEMRTGYPALEIAAKELSKEAERAWLKQLSSWLLYGQLPDFGREDFFICGTNEKQGTDSPRSSEFVIREKMVPKFVTPSTASSILYIGKSIRLVRNRGTSIQVMKSRQPGSPKTSLLAIHLSYLTSLTFPLSPNSFTKAVTAIRVSLSQNTLQELLPLSRILEILSLLHNFFLLGRGEFAIALVTQADAALNSRHRRTTAGLGRLSKKHALEGLMVKEGEVTNVLARTWTELASVQMQDDSNDDELDMARELISLSISKASAPSVPDHDFTHPASKKVATSFRDLLLSTPTTLWMKVPQPLDLFLAKSDLEMYSVINAYILGLRRAHIRLADLWRHTALRREYPSPMGPPRSSTTWGQNALRTRRARANARTLFMRPIWATVGAAVFLLAELGGYFQGEVLEGSWKHFRAWILGPSSLPSSTNPSQPTTSSRPTTSRSDGPSRPATARSEAPAISNSIFGNDLAQSEFASPFASNRDPEALTDAHRLYLQVLYQYLLMDDVSWTFILRKFIAHVDHLIALFTRLQSVQQGLDLEEDDGVFDSVDYKKEEKTIKSELVEAGKEIDSGIKELVHRLREIDENRLGKDRGFDGAGKEDQYVPWKGAGIDRLLMKLDFSGEMVGEGPIGFES
ncbi:MAG: hypothetical protein M1834_001511 [Cirrosporium novae-zelandiae]|nr:MAG: hypothetical protein M1834_004028 [Cirrosporium novae-zelandiae]KAI9735496.1 MAG: hypothetical protein M1834_001511 [Cirrosporium novae-zelandiae]